MKRPRLLHAPNVDARAAVGAAETLILDRHGSAARRAFLRRSLTLGGLAMLSGCSITDDESVERALSSISRFNDRVQAWLFDPKRLAPTYPDSMIERPFPFNAFYREDKVPRIDGETWRLQVRGRVTETQSWSLAQLRGLPQVEHTTRHICIEGWSAIGKWGGVPLADLLRRVGADLQSRYVGFECADGYHTSIDMPTALHPQTILALTHDGRTLPPRHGYPVKVRIPTKLGYKNPKHVLALLVTNTHLGGYWEDQGYNWFGGS
jgi:DMSO/TMAO reductase YedYZ molybdopterin-dependent catalytic subunit